MRRHFCLSKYRLQLFVACLAFSVLLTGCSTPQRGGSILGPGTAMTTSERITLAGVNNTFDNQEFEMVDLISALDPSGLRKKGMFSDHVRAGRVPDDPETPYDDAAAELERSRLEQAMHAFNLPDYERMGLGTRKERRNQIQDRLMAASEARCAAYKQYLRNFENHWETGLGVLGTIAGAAGAIATGDLNARAFAGLAAIFGGARAEVRQGVFRNLATFAIIPGIDQKRGEVQKEIRAAQQAGIDKYSLPAALYDAARFHGACSMDVGLNVARESIQLVDNPGALQISKALARVVRDQQIMRMIDLARDGKLGADEAKVVDVEFSESPVVLYGGKPKSKAKDDAKEEDDSALVLKNRQFSGVTKELTSLGETISNVVTKLRKAAGNASGAGPDDLRQKADCLDALTKKAKEPEMKGCKLNAAEIKDAHAALANGIEDRLADGIRRKYLGETLVALNRCIEHVRTERDVEPDDVTRSKLRGEYESSASSLYQIVLLGNEEIRKKFSAPIATLDRTMANAAYAKIDPANAVKTLTDLTKAELEWPVGELLKSQVRCAMK